MYHLNAFCFDALWLLLQRFNEFLCKLHPWPLVIR